MKRIGGFRVIGKDPTYRKNGKTAAGRAMEASRARREADEARDKALADKLAALLATAPKVAEPEKPVPVEHADIEQAALQTTIVPDPSPRDPTPAERERARGEQLRLAQVAADMAVEVLAIWQQIERDGARARAELRAKPGDVIEFTPSRGSRCEKHDYPLAYTTDGTNWGAPECPVCRQQT